MKAILGRKIGMSQVFSPEGEAIPVTLVQAENNEVSLKRTEERDKYTAVQLTSPIGAKREFKGELEGDVKEVTVEQFSPGDMVKIAGVSKGKGFQGVVKRYGFKGGPASHGHRHVERKPGSIGSRFPQHVLKGRKMAGRMGSDRVTVKNVEIISINKEDNLLAVKGPVPGKRGTLIEIYGE